jgi:serine phosphatase RsbU (regulator of sigma subunit)
MSDGIYEYEDPDGEQFGRERVESILRTECAQPASVLSARLLLAVREFAGDAPQADDVTAVFVRRLAAG